MNIENAEYTRLNTPSVTQFLGKIEDIRVSLTHPNLLDSISAAEIIERLKYPPLLLIDIKTDQNFCQPALSSGSPRINVLGLVCGQAINRDTHRLQLQPCNFFIDFHRNRVQPWF